MPEEVRRLGKLLRAFVWGQLTVGTAWAIATTSIAPASAAFRFGMLAIAAAASAATLALERRGHLRAAAALLVTTMWIALAGRVLATASISHGSWFLFAVLVGAAGLFIGWRAAVVTSAVTAGYGATIVVLVERGVLVPSPEPGPWLDWFAGALMCALIAILQVSAVRLYRGGLEVARQASRRHRALFDSAPVALFELDLHDVAAALAPMRGRAEGDLSAEDIAAACARATTTEVNHAALQLTGHDRAATLRLGPPREVLVPLIEALAHGKQVIEHEVALELAGERRQVVLRATLPEDLRHVVVSLADVTDQRRLAEQAHDARRLETVASLAGSIAHDFNNLLTVSQMNADRLGRRVAALATSRELERIRDANTRAATLTRQLLVFGRRDVAHRQVFGPDRVIEKLEPLLRRTLDPRIDLVIELSSGDATIEMDPAQLELLVTNLVSNASDSIKDRGTVRIACGRRAVAAGTVDELAAADYVSIVVADTGHGMAADARALAFEPFFTTRPGKRAGLGLPIVRSIARDSGGAIVLDSAPETGTRVEVLFPVSTGASRTTDATAGNERILLVEDDDGVREIARSTLEEAGYAVVAVRSGDEALAAIATGKGVDLIVSDLVMPGLGGKELVGRLRSTHPTLPVLYVSGHAADGPPVLEGDTRVGFLAKPFTAAQLLASVRSVLPVSLG